MGDRGLLAITGSPFRWLRLCHPPSSGGALPLRSTRVSADGWRTVLFANLESAASSPIGPRRRIGPELRFGMNSGGTVAGTAIAKLLADRVTPAGQQAPRRCRSHRPSTRQLESAGLFPVERPSTAGRPTSSAPAPPGGSAASLRRPVGARHSHPRRTAARTSASWPLRERNSSIRGPKTRDRQTPARSAPPAQQPGGCEGSAPWC
jgi:hypothetical protein